MRPRTRTIFYVVAAYYLLVASVSAADRIPVFVSIAPQAYFVQQIGKDLVDVQILVEPGADPHTYEPKPQQMVALSKAKLYFAVGIEFEKARLGKLSAMNPNLRIVHTDSDILKQPMVAHHEHGQEETAHKFDADHGHDHGPGNLDPHIWLSPPLVMLQARSMLTALQAVDPAHGSIYESNYRAFIMQLVDLDAKLRSTLDPFKGAPFMVFHPSWGTFAHTYGLRQVPIEIEGKRPKPAQLKELIQHARSDGIKVVFVQPQFSTKSAEQISKAIDGRVAVVDPLAQDWATHLKKAAEELKHALQ